MVIVKHGQENEMDRYVNEIVDNFPDAFGTEFWAADTSDFELRLFRLMANLRPTSNDESKLLKEVMRLMVVTFIMGHPITIAEETKMATLSRLHSYTGPGPDDEKACSPRLLNYQLKHFFSRLHKTTMTSVLNKLHQIFKSSKGCDKWMPAVCAVLGLGIALEHHQKTIYSIAASVTDLENGRLDPDSPYREIDQKFKFIAQLFRWKYNRKSNPFTSKQDAAEVLDDAGMLFVQQVASLVRENSTLILYPSGSEIFGMLTPPSSS
jgi:hypothetical protein